MKKYSSIKAVASSSLFVIKYWIALIALFQISRVFFLLFNNESVKTIGLKQALLACLYGLRMDMSMSTYLILPFLILSIFALFFKETSRLFVFQAYTGLFLFSIVFLWVVDVLMFQAWGFRLDATPLKYIMQPREAWASIEHMPLVFIAVLLFGATFLLIKANNLFLKRNISHVDFSSNRILIFISMLLLAALAIIPLRGGLQLAPINQSAVYFSPDNFANQAALNGPWNLMYSLTHSASETGNPFSKLENAEATSILEEMYKEQMTRKSLLIHKSTQPPNVVILIWEGLTWKVIDSVKEGEEITPAFNDLKQEGVYFSNLYATGDRTDKGLVAILSGYPSNPKQSIVKVPRKAGELPMLSKVFSRKNYHTSFYYGGETEFANMKSYLLQGQFEKIISVDDFAAKELNSKWGAHDEVVMNKVFKDLSTVQQPFFCTWLTLSSHEPFDVPSSPVITGGDEESLYLNSLHYTDSVVGLFVRKLQRSSLWQNTVLLVVADHGSRMPKASSKADDFRIGALLLGGLVKHPRIISRIGSQIDLAGMLLQELHGRDTAFSWSRNLLDSSSLPWSFFSFNNGFGYVEPLGTIIYDNVGGRLMQKSGTAGELQIKRGKALQQYIYQDFLDK